MPLTSMQGLSSMTLLLGAQADAGGEAGEEDAEAVRRRGQRGGNAGRGVTQHIHSTALNR